MYCIKIILLRKLQQNKEISYITYTLFFHHWPWAVIVATYMLSHIMFRMEAVGGKLDSAWMHNTATSHSSPKAWCTRFHGARVYDGCMNNWLWSKANTFNARNNLRHLLIRTLISWLISHISDVVKVYRMCLVGPPVINNDYLWTGKPKSSWTEIWRYCSTSLQP